MKEVTIKEANNGYIITYEEYKDGTIYTFEYVFTEIHHMLNYLAITFIWDRPEVLEELKEMWSK